MIKEMIRYAGILALICFLASGLLAGVNALTQPRIIALAYAQEQSALAAVLPEAASFEPVPREEETLYYRGMSESGDLVGLAFKARGQGYAGPIEAMAGMSRDGQITVIQILSQNETPGLGSRVADQKFTGQFAGKPAETLEGVNAITGATISSRALINAVKQKASEVLAAEAAQKE